ncbi:MAG: XdhC family protein [Eubacteriales bacterium]|nr:XdhC family protein [Eubacteriales bacterium]
MNKKFAVKIFKIMNDNIYKKIAELPADKNAVLAVILESPVSAEIGKKALFVDGEMYRANGCIGAAACDDTSGDLSYYHAAEICTAAETKSNSIIEIAGRSIFISRLGSTPRVIICGGGHVALALLRILKSLESETVVIEDRRDFADKAAAAGADKVICLGFEEGLKEVPQSSDNYFVCMTRGHNFDIECMRAILAVPNAYVGLMGSRGRCAKMRADLISEGYPEEAVNAVHAPIGLKIGAQSPEEIAVSVAAELIQVKYEVSRKGIFDREILEVLAGKKDGDVGTNPGTNAEAGIETAGTGYVLCTIIEKHGSAPRAAGTRMLVSADGIVAGTVGGGSMEYEVMLKSQELLKSHEAFYIMEASANTADIIDDGLLCGGRIKVMLEVI